MHIPWLTILHPGSRKPALTPDSETRINHEVRQDARTTEFVHSVPRCIADVTKFITLDAGDLILMGSPAGVGVFQGLLLKPGDLVELSADRIGTLRNPIVAASWPHAELGARKLNRSLLPTVVATALAIAAQAPSASAEGAAAQGAVVIEEIVVTARKKDESIIDVPISIAVTTGADIQKQGFRDLQSIVAAVPAVNLSRAGGAETMNIRGTGSGENSGFEQSVGFVIDGISVGRSRATRAGLLDVDRLEILKGPQTTYFGANTIAGVVSIVTRGASISDGVGGYVRSSYEIEAEEFVVEGGANLPLSDTFALRVAGKYTDSQGFIKDEGVGHKVPATEDSIARISALWAPNDQLTAELKYTRSEMDANSGLDVQITNCEPFIPPGVPGGPQGGIGQLNCIQADGQPVEDELNYKRNNDMEGERSLTMDMALLDIDYAIGEYTLTSMTGLYQFENYFVLDLDLTSVPSLVAPSRFSTAQEDSSEHFSQELRLTSPAGRRFEWMAGVYYRKEDVDYLNTVVTAFSPPIPPFAPPALGNSGAPTTQETETLSAFGTLQFNVTDRLRASVGLRYIEADKTFVQPPNTPAVVPPSGIAQARSFQPLFPLRFFTTSRKDDDLLPSVDLQYELTDSANVYFSYRQGFKGGAFSLSNPPPGVTANFIQTVGPESVEAFEVGLKGVFLDNRLSANVALFLSNFDDRQVTSLSETAGTEVASLSQAIANAAKGRAKGIEVDFNARLSDQVTLLGNFTYLDSTFRDFPNAPCYTRQTPAQGCVDGVQDLGGHVTTFAPEYAGSLSLVYEQPVGDYFLTIEPNVFFTDGYGIISDFNPRNNQGGFTKVNLRIALAPASDQWEVALVGRNLGDELTTHFCQEVPAVQTPNTVACAADPPPTYAIQARYNF